MISPDGRSGLAVHRLKDEALADLRGLIATLPDNHYKIYLGSHGQQFAAAGSRRVRAARSRGRSVGRFGRHARQAADRRRAAEPGAAAQKQSVHRRAGPESAGGDERADGSGRAKFRPSRTTGRAVSAETVTPATMSPRRSAPSSSRLRWAVPLAGLGLVAQRGSWSREVDAAFDRADDRAWQRLRRAGRRQVVKSARRDGRRKRARIQPSQFFASFRASLWQSLRLFQGID